MQNKECEWVLPRAGDVYCRAKVAVILLDEGWPPIHLCQKHLGLWVIKAAKRNSQKQITIGQFGVIRIPQDD